MATTPIPTTLSPTTIPDTEITCQPIEIGPISLRSAISLSPARGRDTTLDASFEVGPIEITVSQEGYCQNIGISDNQISLSIDIGGSLKVGVIISCDTIPISVSIIHKYIDFPLAQKSNWVAWSKIGIADFTIDHSNVAGERPLDWPGMVYQVIKLGDSVIAYGSNGITIMSPKDVYWGIKTIRRIGLKYELSVCGNDYDHFFVDAYNKLCHLSQSGLEVLDYSEYLKLLVNPVVSIDWDLGLVYICDESLGFIYNMKTRSFGSGPSGITGFGLLDGERLVVSPVDISTPKFSICTDIYDFGTRKPKTIQDIELGTDLTNKLRVSIDSRISNKDDFRQSRWVLVNPSGIAHIPCYGIEFRIRVKSDIYEYLGLDYIKVSGILHQFDYLNAVQ